MLKQESNTNCISRTRTRTDNLIYCQIQNNKGKKTVELQTCLIKRIRFDELHQNESQTDQ